MLFFYLLFLLSLLQSHSLLQRNKMSCIWIWNCSHVAQPESWSLNIKHSTILREQCWRMMTIPKSFAVDVHVKSSLTVTRNQKLPSWKETDGDIFALRRQHCGWSWRGSLLWSSWMECIKKVKSCVKIFFFFFCPNYNINLLQPFGTTCTNILLNIE